MIMDNEILRAWLLIHELSDQLTHNQKISNALQSQVAAVKVNPITTDIHSFHKTITRTKLYKPVLVSF